MNGINPAIATRKQRILFMAEAVTLAHVARPHVLAQSLPTDQFEVLFACDPRYNQLFKDATYLRRPIETIPSARFLKLLERGSPIYDYSTLAKYLVEDLAVIDDFKPDAIVGDFRLTLAVSARLRGVPYVAISNAYWSPDAIIDCPVPELPLTKWLGYHVGGALFRLGKSTGFAIHARAHNQLRRQHGLSPLAADIRHFYNDGDAILFADVSEIVTLRHSSPRNHFVGPIQWSPSVDRPMWWHEAENSQKPIIYLTLGSSGDLKSMPILVRALAELGGTVLVATAGRMPLNQTPKNVYAAEFLPGLDAAAISDLVVCNGGSPTTYQAIAAAKPVLGIPSNLDQCLNIAAMKSVGVGDYLRIGNLSLPKITKTARDLIERPNKTKLQALAHAISACNPVQSLMSILRDVDPVH